MKIKLNLNLIKKVTNQNLIKFMKKEKKRILTFAQAINEAQHQALKLNNNIFIFGQAVDKTKNVFGTSEGILEKFGKKRIFDTANSEQAETMLAAGAAINGLRPILIHHRVDFMAYSFDQLVNWISLWAFKSSKKSFLPLVIRGIIGKGWGQGPQHAKTLHSMFAYLPGLKVVMPSSPSEAKGLLLSSIMSNDPVIFLEYRSLYNTKEYVPKNPYYIKIDEPRKRLSGKDLTIIAMGSSVLTSIEAIKKLEEKKISVELIDLRSVSNFNYKEIFKSARKTRRILVVEDGWKKLSISSEIISRINEENIILKKPPRRICWPNSHIPMNRPLEKRFYFDYNDVVKECIKLMKN